MNRIFPWLVLALALAGSAWAQGFALPDDYDDVLDMMTVELEATGKVDRIERRDQQLHLFAGDESLGYLNPDNLYYQLLKTESDEERQVLVATHVRIMLGVLGDDTPATDLSQDTLDRVYPVLRHKGYDPGNVDVTILKDPFSDELAVQFVFDSPETASIITEERLADAGIDADTLRRAAKANLAQFRSALTIEGDGLYYLVLDGYYENALVLDFDLWRTIESQIGPVAMVVPARDAVLFGAADDPGVRVALAELALEISADNGGMTSAEMFRFTGEGWAQLAP